MKLLLVEDDAKTVAILRKGLVEHGYTVDSAATGPEGFAKATAGFDLVILDVMLPGKDGWSILRDLRVAGVTTPVLILTARDAVRDRVKGLELGADDYLVKPYAFAELLARVRTLLRRGPARSPDCLHVADLEVDFTKLKAARSGATLELTPKEFALLALLARRTGEVLSRNLIAGQVWGVDYDPGTNVVDVHVRRLRAKADDPFEAKLIHTVRGVGYVLEPRS
jgi:two-component system copper resistance phosphate regulon response regulator CusR